MFDSERYFTAKTLNFSKRAADQWEKALAYAPSVSMGYWRSVALRYAEHLAEKDEGEAAAYYVLGNEHQKAIDSMIRKENYRDGELLAYLSLSGSKTEFIVVL